MEEESKNYYRGIIEKLARKYKVSEIYIAEKIIDLCNRYVSEKREIEKKKAHIGYYLVDDGIYELREKLENKKVFSLNKQQKVRLYLEVLALAYILISL